MIWYSAIFAGLSMALAVLIASFIFGRKPRNKTGYTIVLMVLFLVFHNMSKKLILPEIKAYKTKSDIEAAFENIPAYSSLKKNEPGIYKDMLNSLAEGIKTGANQEQANSIMRTEMGRIINSKLPHASGKAIVTYIKSMIKQIDELQSQGGDLCFKFLYPKIGGGVNALKVFTQETINIQLAAVDEIIKTSNSKRDIPTENEIMPDLDAVFDKLIEKYGEDASIIDNPTANNVDKVKACNINRDLYNHIVELPVDQAAALLRWMFGQSL
jgi:hypothetical protein